MPDAKADTLVPPGPMRRDALTKHVKRIAKESGFDYVGITTADDLPDAESVAIERLRQGLMDGLPWYYESRVQRGCRPTSLLPGARSIIALGLSYYTPASPTPEGDKLRGRIARYAWGEDYHKVMERRAKALVARLRDLGGESARFYVDYGPMPDRAVAQRAGIGWFGKNTNLLTPGQGSWLFLAELLTTLDLTPDAPLKKSCGQCTLCIPACPTNAIPEPYVIDTTRCISYHTIENRGPIPRELRSLMGDWVFGCDVCQDVCPVNDAVAPTGDTAFRAASVENERPDLLAILSLTQEQFRERFKGSPVRRAKLNGLKRNACVALGNLGDSTAVPPLINTLREDEALVRGHAAWALGRIGGEVARAALTEALGGEADSWVREEIQRALDTPT